MWISLCSIRQWVFGSAGIGSLLIAGLPAAWANNLSVPAPSPVHPLKSHRKIASSPSLRDPASANSASLRAPEHSWSEIERIVKPGHSVLPPPSTLEF